MLGKTNVPTCSPTGRATTRFTAPPATRGTSRARPAARRVARRPRLRPAWRRWNSAPTSAARCARRRTSPASSDSSRGSGWCPGAGLPARRSAAPRERPCRRRTDGAHRGRPGAAVRVIAGPDELSKGIGYRLALRPPRHEQLAAFACCSSTATRCADRGPRRPALDRLAGRLAHSGNTVVRSQPLCPISPRRGGSTCGWCCRSRPPSATRASRVSSRSRPLPSRPTTAAFGGARPAIGLSHRNWLRPTSDAPGSAAMARLFREVDVVLCPPMPVTAFAHDHSAPAGGRRLEVDGKPCPISTSWSGPGRRRVRAAGGGGADGPRRQPVTDRRPDHRPFSRGPYGDGFCGLIEREFGGFISPPASQGSLIRGGGRGSEPRSAGQRAAQSGLGGESSTRCPGALSFHRHHRLTVAREICICRRPNRHSNLMTACKKRTSAAGRPIADSVEKLEGPAQDSFSGVTQPFPTSRSSILDRSERSIFVALCARPRERSFSTESARSGRSLRLNAPKPTLGV